MGIINDQQTDLNDEENGEQPKQQIENVRAGAGGASSRATAAAGGKP